MSVIVIVGGGSIAILAIYGAIDICLKVKKRILYGKEDDQNLVSLADDELAGLMQFRANNGDENAKEWLKENGYEEKFE